MDFHPICTGMQRSVNVVAIATDRVPKDWGVFTGRKKFRPQSAHLWLTKSLACEKRINLCGRNNGNVDNRFRTGHIVVRLSNGERILSIGTPPQLFSFRYLWEKWPECIRTERVWLDDYIVTKGLRKLNFKEQRSLCTFFFNEDSGFHSYKALTD